MVLLTHETRLQDKSESGFITQAVLVHVRVVRTRHPPGAAPTYSRSILPPIPMIGEMISHELEG